MRWGCVTGRNSINSPRKKPTAWRCWRAVVLLCVALAWNARAQNLSFPPQTNCSYDLSAVTQAFTNTLAQNGIANGSLLVLKDGQKLHEQFAGIYQPNTLRVIASASKWLSAVVIMSLVDDGLLSLDDPASKFFPADYTGQKGTMTIRQMFSHTSGLPGTHEDWVLSADDITLQQAAQIISTNDLIAAPGTVLCYGGLSMHLAGACAEVASGQSWSNLFELRVKRPLGLTLTTYGNTPNPRIAGGVSSTLYEYATVLQMLLQHGVWGTNQVLSSNAVHVMLQDQTGGAQILCSPYQQYGLGETRYGIGAWLEEVSPGGRAYQIGSGGAFGFAPWIDLDRNVAGVFMVVNLMENVFPGVQQIKAAVRTAVDNTPCNHPPYLHIQPAGGNTNLITLHGARGRSYTLESSGNLTAWTNYLTLPGTNGLWGIPLAATNASHQFLRAKVLP
jgi:CubicO group peptidase (beta-lactamase class C family)